MQLQFEKQELSCLQTLTREVQNQEQTQEIRISDGMPDIGRIIGAWGQVILRGKEWQAEGMTVSGGTMVWVQYMPEEGGQPQCVESWLPFQMHWSFPQTRHDGSILTRCFLQSVDARSTSARKMMLRTNVSVLAWAMENRNWELYVPADVPEDVELHRVRYPVQLPAEVGEKAFSLEESLEVPPSVPAVEQLLSYHLQPEITEEKIMGDKVIFRGNACLHMLYLADDGGQYSWDFELPFTQYSELDREYGEDAEAVLWPCVTALEIDREADRLNVKAGLVCQYRICHRPVVEVVEDAYSPRRAVLPVLQDLELPGILQRKTQNLHIQQNLPLNGMRLTDVRFFAYPVQVRNGAEGVEQVCTGQFQILYYDMEGAPQTALQKWEHRLHTQASPDSTTEAVLWPVGKIQGSFLSGNAQLSGDVKLQTETVCGKGIPMVTGLELGEPEPADPQRPSLILCRADGKSLWELAKENASTQTAIREANPMLSGSEENPVLLIPVI